VKGRRAARRSVGSFSKSAASPWATLFQIKLVPSDQEAFHTWLDKKAAAAIVPRPYGFVAEDKGFHRMLEWNDMVDDPLPITIETTLPPALHIDILHKGKLVAQGSTANAANARQILSEWAIAGAVKPT